ncbi:MAG: hypothetical protein DRQ43_03040 [Gammaproteobacteria bacterium]|nr:MAG: hypothetical protein DRQ43_03040 [Gammaproteobacteria bacterium]
MGLFIHLFVNTHNISTEQWESTYHESLELLNKFPANLIRFDTEEIDGHKRYRYTRQLIVDKETRGEKWIISGDMASDKQAESFALPRYLKDYYDQGDDRDILWADEDSLHYVDGNGLDLFGNKTQGYPYHLVVLAVGILVESRFPGSAYVIGDIENEQAENMTAWVNTVLKKPVEKPVCCDAQRLFSRLDKLYRNGMYTIQRFRAVSRENDEQIFAALLQLSDRKLVLNDTEQRLGEYTSLNQLGAINIISQFLKVIPDIKQLIEIVNCIIKGSGTEKSEDFSLEKLLEVLVRNMITTEKDKREPITQLADNINRMGNINHVMGVSVMKILNFNPSYIDCYLPRGELLDIFSTYDLDKRSGFEKIINESEQCCNEQLKEYREAIQEVEDIISQKEKQCNEQNHPTFAMVSAMGKDEQQLINLPYTSLSHAKQLSVQEHYILEEVDQQRVKFKNPLEATRHIGDNLQQLIKENTEYLRFETRKQGLTFIYKASIENGIVLKEHIWRLIDKEQDMDLLRTLLVLMLVADNSANFCDWRIFILEHPELWREMRR